MNPVDLLPGRKNLLPTARPSLSDFLRFCPAVRAFGATAHAATSLSLQTRHIHAQLLGSARFNSPHDTSPAAIFLSDTAALQRPQNKISLTAGTRQKPKPPTTAYDASTLGRKEKNRNVQKDVLVHRGAGDLQVLQGCPQKLWFRGADVLVYLPAHLIFPLPPFLPAQLSMCCTNPCFLARIGSGNPNRHVPRPASFERQKRRKSTLTGRAKTARRSRIPEQKGEKYLKYDISSASGGTPKPTHHETERTSRNEKPARLLRRTVGSTHPNKHLATR